MPILAPGTEQRRWRRMGSGVAPFSALPGKGAFAYRSTQPVGYNFDGTWTIAMEDQGSDPARPLTDMCCALRFYFVKTTGTIPSAVARVWGLSRVHLLGESDEAFLGTYIGQVGFELGTSNGLPQETGPFDAYKNVLLEDSYLASRVVVQHDRGLSPPRLRVVGNSNAGSGRAPFVLFDALGFDRIVVSLRFTAPAGTNGLGVFWTTM